MDFKGSYIRVKPIAPNARASSCPIQRASHFSMTRLIALRFVRSKPQRILFRVPVGDFRSMDWLRLLKKVAAIENMKRYFKRAWCAGASLAGGLLTVSTLFTGAPSFL